MVKVKTELSNKRKGGVQINLSILSNTVYVNRDYVANDINNRIFVSLVDAYNWIKYHGGGDKWRIIADLNEDASFIDDNNIQVLSWDKDVVDFKTYSIELKYDEWENNIQSFDLGFSDDAIIFVSPLGELDNIMEYGDNKIFLSNDIHGIIEFTCVTVPKNDLFVNVVITDKYSEKYTRILYKDNWENNEQEVFIDNPLGKKVFVSPYNSEDDINNYASTFVFGYEEIVNGLVFKCKEVPDKDIRVNIVII